MIIVSRSSESEVVADIIATLMHDKRVKSVSTSWAGDVERNVITLRGDTQPPLPTPAA